MQDPLEASDLLAAHGKLEAAADYLLKLDSRLTEDRCTRLIDCLLYAGSEKTLQQVWVESILILIISYVPADANVGSYKLLIISLSGLGRDDNKLDLLTNSYQSCAGWFSK